MISHTGTPPANDADAGARRRYGRIADILKTHHFDPAFDLEQTLHRYVTLYNSHLPPSALGSQTPIP
jgi:hypothetical protein